MTTKKPEVKKVDKFKTNPIAKRMKADNMKWEEQVTEALVTAEYVKSWNKYEGDSVCMLKWGMIFWAIILGIVVGILTTHSSVMEMLKVCTA